MSGKSLLTLMAEDRVWCSGWRDKDQSCEDVAFLEVKGKEVSQTSRFRMLSDPDVQLVVRETLKLEGGSLCSTFRFSALEAIVLRDGEPAQPAEALPLLAAMAEAMADFEGKKACEAYTRNNETGEVHGRVTLDGEHAPEFDSIYRLIAPDTRIKLRPMIDEPESTTIT
ncbi:hypothetical protein [Caulobacter mirabilis]|uniref:Uncharacterized protein n=1 Tax=Caulobacter mirabilis TaxID=69666 RepID=A0A2D2AVP6_9CAUL|nr:hypothetical protein [Caulobacter mirabilis]ATQ42089.1 hypothetical protein CSW64_06495 [Caulobacter mirabilis]